MTDEQREKRLTVLFVPLSSIGHTNPSVTLALAMKKNGHRIVFAMEASWTNKMTAYGFEEELYTEREVKEAEDPSMYWKEGAKQMEPLFREPLNQKVPHVLTASHRMFMGVVMYSDDQIKDIVNRVKPDIIVQDNYVCYPSLVTFGKPIVFLHSANPLTPLNLLRSSTIPPPCFGLPLSDTSLYEESRQIYDSGLTVDWNKLNGWMTKKGAPALPENHYQYVSTNLNLYVYPEICAKDYTKNLNLGDEWMGLDHAVRPMNDTFQLPSKLKSLPGKLILFSLGSMGSSLVELMKRLIEIFAKTKHRFIVSTGPEHDKFILPENMWGQEHIPQLAILPMVDLFITHGGNNSFVEALYFGKPMIVLPVFFDQYDNAQRAVEMNFGRRFDPFTVNDKELLEAIEELLNDEKLIERVKSIGEQIRSSTSLQKVVDKIERVAKNPKIPSVLV